LHLAGLARDMAHRRTRQMALLSGALALGCGIWTMHYIGMLAFAVCGHTPFDPWITLLSVVPALGASWVALRLLVREHVGPAALAGSGLLVGAGIGAMHYIGMAASELAPLMHYDLGGFILSIAVAVLLAVVALWVRFGVQQRWQGPQGGVTAVAGCVMGLAIAGMHYTGMAALRFAEPIDGLNRETSTMPVQTTLALAIAVVAMALGIVIVAANANLRYRQMLWTAKRSESRLRAMSDTAVDGIITINGRGIVQSFNGAAERMLGWQAEEVIGRNVSMLMPDPHRSAHDGYLFTHLTTGHSSIIGRGREVDALRKDGSLLPIRLAVGRVAQSGETLFVGFLTDISARRAMENALRQREEQLRTLVGNIPGVAFRCRNEEHWPIEFISDAVQPLTGWSADDFLRDRISFSQLIDPDDARNIAPEVDGALRQGQPYHVEFRITTREGHRRWLSAYGRGAADEQGTIRWIDGVILDVTETKEHWAQFVSTVKAFDRSEAVAEFDLQGRLINANANFLRLVGYERDEVLGQSHAMFCDSAFAYSPAWHNFWQRLGQGEFATGEFQRFGKGGREVWIHATYNPILDANGKVFKIIKFVTDMSQRRAMEQDLRAAKERAEAAAAARASFLANMSHEIRTPMNAILGFTEALLDSPLEPTQRRHLGTVQHAARSLLHLLNDILDTAKLDKGAVVLEILDFSLRQLCQQMLDTLRISAARKGLPLVLDYPGTEPDYLRGDALRLQQVLLNLLGNAIKFTEQGQVLLRVRYRDGQLQVDVEDTGIGMSAAQIERIFDPFAQADASTTRRFGGTGLGTTIARQLVELMQGQISVRSQPGQGSVFSVHLPLPLGEASAVKAEASVPVLPPLRVLAVDDVPANLELLQIAMARDGHTITLASNGQEALDCCARVPFDLVLMDLQMPGLDGLEAARRIRQREQALGLARLPLIALSASVLEEDQDQALQAGMDGFAHKPLDRPRLFAEIARVLGLSSPPAAPSGTHVGAPASDPAPIDWAQGRQLWGSDNALRTALERFMREHAQLPATLQDLHARNDGAALEALAHRLRGAAANLGLGPLQALLGAVETAARTANTAAL
ncbi:MAG: PAS domain S-box protein, partial [Giesbergeria sp.]|nr:PAS domain S-box protein [Giesbergeria sp.]